MSESNLPEGSALESLLCEEGIYEGAKGEAIRSVLAYKLEEATRLQGLSRDRMAQRMETRRSQVDRLLDPESEGVTLHTLRRAAFAIGLRLELALRKGLIQQVRAGTVLAREEGVLGRRAGNGPA